MKIGAIALVLAVCLCFGGCGSWMDGEYVYTSPHENMDSSSQTGAVHAENYWQLYHALEDMMESGTLQGVILVSKYDQSRVLQDAADVANKLMEDNPIAAYAVSAVKSELGTTGGEAALAVEITYVHDRSEIRRIQSVVGTDAAVAKIQATVSACDVGIVLLVDQFEPVDFVQIVENYAVAYPEYVIEQPAVTVNVYPNSGSVRVVEIKLSYTTSRETLKEMQQRVRNLFTSASLYVNADTQDYDKLYHLYTFMMERTDYVIKTSITPAYSLLLHGVGDQRAFAMVYAAMCAREKISCYMVTGTRNGEAHYWNIVCVDGAYYHMDLLQCSEKGKFALQLDTDMSGYVWDYDAYPRCDGKAVAAIAIGGE